ncbi:hypothetical protein BKA64DRAFT_143978 [Cadophora sp. MPI-SDFR-AT-0126]|nr:hypothetical protein BKA64DRAFT_143978 [Leotiomycetes sp. MPI-SDFR-AT-0126]
MGQDNAMSILHSFTMSRRSQEPGLYTGVPLQEGRSLVARLWPSEPQPVKWSHSQASVGKHCCTFSGKAIWEIQDPGRSILEPLLDKIKRYLNEQSEILRESLREREACQFSFDIFMIGRSESTACPTLVFISVNKTSRGKIVKAIRDSGILDTHPYVLLGQCSKHPRYPDSRPLKPIAFDVDATSSLAQPNGTVYVEKSIADKHMIVSGTTIYISVVPKAEERSRFRKATLGGFLRLTSVDGSQKTTTMVGMTVAHAFQDLSKSDSTVDHESDNDGFEIEFDGPSPDSIFGDDNSSTSSFKSSPGTKINELVSQISPGVPPSNQLVFDEGELPELLILGELMAMSNQEHQNYDWALIKILSKDLNFSNNSSKHSRPDSLPLGTISFPTRDDIPVTTLVDPVRRRKGVLSGHSTFVRLEHATEVLEVKTVLFDSNLAYGDSGMWVVNGKTLCGHIIAGDLSTGLGYVLPATNVFQQIEYQLGCIIDFPNSGSLKAEISGASFSPLGTKQEQRKSFSGDPIAKRVDEPIHEKESARGIKSGEDSKIHGHVFDMTPGKAIPKTPQSMTFSTPNEYVDPGIGGSKQARRRDSPRDWPAAATAARPNEYFILGDGIDREVIGADIRRYLGNDASVRPGAYENPTTRQVQDGYFITAYRKLTPVSPILILEQTYS